ncbi:phosphatidylinositol-specific phospholipase C/glycerophosphodiester phosphodiesterase family protein [Massilibacteroides sp.]|uniref:phosphatidylinositol-specific phospholipase C/glycerophosphodiester phosphodiesterase family protein n=1 Tax=Massilibacteroides sp. TaxID=2034766 RepID=UPI002601D808|nr:phosphatidylinositol-specific phospholipase C/glycerophosphodiester phosphodiesterase family protein [Massilibacteroides sp.]MDD4515745.1 phosphatidylinositol-specific phospholipase C/glycerophosphodiester phosphodiesterase family protein [Massilibacteroides sp.]
MNRIILFLFILISVNCNAQRIHYNAFSHNDYWRNRPLFDALDYGFNCVEADLWLINGELYVAHDRPEPNDSILFSELYLKPLSERIKENGGKVFPSSDRPFFLMVDCKTNGEEMYPLLKQQLNSYKNLFCSVEDGVYKEGAVLLFVSGDRPMDSIFAETNRIAFLDGRINDLGKDIPKIIMPVVSDNYNSYISWRGEGKIPEEELMKMRKLIKQTHDEGKLFRWWGAPDTPEFKRFFIKEGVDLVGADDLRTLSDVLE